MVVGMTAWASQHECVPVVHGQGLVAGVDADQASPWQGDADVLRALVEPDLLVTHQIGDAQFTGTPVDQRRVPVHLAERQAGLQFDPSKPGSDGPVPAPGCRAKGALQLHHS